MQLGVLCIQQVVSPQEGPVHSAVPGSALDVARDFELQRID